MVSGIVVDKIHDSKPKGQWRMNNPETQATLGTRHSTTTNKPAKKRRKIGGNTTREAKEWPTNLLMDNANQSQLPTTGSISLAEAAKHIEKQQ